jgi:hypothetical protein
MVILSSTVRCSVGLLLNVAGHCGPGQRLDLYYCRKTFLSLSLSLSLSLRLLMSAQLLMD